MLTRLYQWTMRQAASRHASPALAAVSFIESSVFPIPPDVMLIPMVLARPQHAFRIATICTVASILGGLFGYAIGYFLFESIGEPLIGLYGYAEEFARFRESYNEYGAWIVAFFGFTPFPYKVITIASGVTQLDLVSFTVASVLSRGGRFYLVALCLWYFGEPIRRFIEKYLGLLTLLFFVLLFGGFLVLRWLA